MKIEEDDCSAIQHELDRNSQLDPILVLDDDDDDEEYKENLFQQDFPVKGNSN